MSDTSSRPLWGRPPAAALLVAVLASILHMAPHFHGRAQTPEGYTFSGNTRVSPDNMQYRIWMRRSQETGVLVSNTFTSEPNPPHLPVVSYWAMGRIARATGASPETVYQWAGVPFAFALVLLVFAACRHFTRQDRHAWWIFGTILLAGGLESVDSLLQKAGIGRLVPGYQRLVHEAFTDALFFTSYRGHYVFQTFFDTHFLLIWTFTLLAALLAYDFLARRGRGRLALALVAFGASTVLHIYDGMVLLAIASGVTVVLWLKGRPLRDPLRLLVGGALVVGALVGAQMLLWRSSGLPLPRWREVNILLAVVVAAYPLAWIVLLPRLTALWSRNDLQASFLTGWAGALLVMVLSGPFYPYPSRGSLTLSVALYLCAGVAYFGDRARVPLLAALVAVALIAPNPLLASYKRYETVLFQPERKQIYYDADMLAMISFLEKNAAPTDVLLVDRTRPGWETDDRWLAPTYPGLLYCGHFFLTVDFEHKRQLTTEFYSGKDAKWQSAFLKEAGIRWIFAGPEHDVARLERLPDVRVRLKSPAGTLLEHVAVSSGT